MGTTVPLSLRFPTYAPTVRSPEWFPYASRNWRRGDLQWHVRVICCGSFAPPDAFLFMQILFFFFLLWYREGRLLALITGLYLFCMPGQPCPILLCAPLTLMRGALCCHLLLCVAMRCHLLPCVALCCFVLPCVALCYHVLLCVAMCCSVLLCVAMCCFVLPCVVLCCYVLLYVVMCCHVLLCVAMCCFVLLCVAMCCHVLLYVALIMLPCVTVLPKSWRKNKGRQRVFFGVCF